MTDNANIILLDPDLLDAGWEQVNSRPIDGLFHGTREEWAVSISLALLPELAKLGITMVGERRQIRVAVAPLPATKLGLCYSASKSVAGNTNIITLSSDQGEPIELAHTLLHEILHALDDCRSGHKGRWARWAEMLGMERCGHARNAQADQMLRSALERVGLPALHVQTKSQRRKQRKSQVRFICTSCGGHVHMPAAIAEAGTFHLLCTTCDRQLEQAH
jgi:hypothetical protein